MDAGEDVKVPLLLQQGTPMTKVSAKKKKTVIFRIDADEGCIHWESNKAGIIAIENIKELRSGADARYYREQFQLSSEYESRWITIIYILDGSYKTLHLIATSTDVFRMWDSTLRALFAVRQQLMSGLGHGEQRQAVWEKRYWKGADEGGDEKLTFAEVECMCKRLNVNFSAEEMKSRFEEADVQKRGYLDFSDFQRFVKLIKVRPELTQLYTTLSGGKDGVLDFTAFEKFMRDSQKSSLSKDELENIFARYATKQEEGRPSTITLDAFTSYLLSPDNAVFTDHNGKVWQDMTRPLSEYFISSSHNTYLVGHQLVGVSTIEGYIRALLHSCRSVELDIYDGETEPVIYHGKTFTSKVPLRDICVAIAKYAFVASPYPIVISAEVHCSLPQQDLIAEIMKATFGDALVTAPVDGQKTIEVLPSPEALKGKVLLKAKNLYVSEHEQLREKSLTVDTESSTETSSDTDMMQEFRVELNKARNSEPVKELKEEFQKARNMESLKEIKGEFLKARNIVSRVRQKSPPPSQASSSAPASPRPHALSLPPRSAQSPLPTAATAASTAPAPPKVKMSLDLVGLLVYTVGVKCRGFNKKEHYAPEHVFSLSERTANKVLKQSMWDLVKHNRTHVVRIYPSGTRLNSSNYEPHRYWCAGAQLVAINWQTFDLGYMINHAMFQRNGRAGYVLKPLALRSPTKDLFSKYSKHVLDVTIISAQQLPRPKDALGHEIILKSPIDPCVEVSIHIPDWTHSPFVPASPPPIPPPPPSSPPAAAAASTARVATYKTSVVKNNGFNPVWEETLSLPFDCVGDMMDLIFVKFAVKDEKADDNEPLAVFCVSLGSIQQGYRHLPLHDSQLSQYLFSTLFVKISIRET
ncbi:PLC-like phosphodiesterase [Rickenella mellea]|uniref:Phosphoinositide phospholipase C n=1 Tax=Rickenella mellea TaxID=50990 RepID=A0A4Y7QJI0_9AGAM|nr:PLC-like phosphodiesterase [Rickenella mellea]